MARKYTYEEKLNIVEGYLNGDFTLSEKAHELGYHAIPGCFQRWIKQYKVHGREGLHRKNRTYTSELKMKAVEEYLSGKRDLKSIAAEVFKNARRSIFIAIIQTLLKCFFAP